MLVIIFGIKFKMLNYSIFPMKLFRIEPHVEPVNGVVQPPVVPPVNRPGRITNQLHYLKTTIIKGTFLDACTLLATQFTKMPKFLIK